MNDRVYENDNEITIPATNLTQPQRDTSVANPCSAESEVGKRMRIG
jgi:hypothetical protein